MAQLYSSGIASRLILIGYDFEMAWLRSLITRISNRAGVIGADADAKLEIVAAPEGIAEWPTPPILPQIDWPSRNSPTTESPLTPGVHTAWQGIDIWDFEYNIANQRKAPPPQTSSATTAVDCMAVRYVSFVGLGYAFFCPNRALPVITDLIRNGEKALQSRSLPDLRPGDLVVFPQVGGSDLISHVADKLLAGRADALRNTADQYHLKLRSSGLTPQQFIDRAKPLGFSRSLTTVRQWFEGSRVIGPDRDEDIETIQRILGGNQWAALCIDARRELRQAHGAAEGRIRKALLAHLAQHLDEIESSGCQLELGELGKVWVQCVDSVSEQAEYQPRSKCNRLLGVD